MRLSAFLRAEWLSSGCHHFDCSSGVDEGGTRESIDSASHPRHSSFREIQDWIRLSPV